jgi:hypothetical protein
MKINLFILGWLAACGTDPVATPDAPAGTAPTISGIVPDRGFVGRDVRVEISGDATHWTDGTTVAFGAGVTVHSVAVASPTSLFADVAVADAAAAGLADVTVTGGDGTLVLHAGFAIEPPLQISVAGTLAQGSLVTLHIANQDFEHPFDLSTRIFGGPFPNIDIESPAGTTLQTIDSASEFEVVADFTIDVDAAPGELVIDNGPPGHGVRMSAGTLPVAARTAVELAPNTPFVGGAVEALDTVLFQFTPAPAPSVTLVSTNFFDFTLLPASGHFAESFSSQPIGAFAQFDPVVLLADKYFMIAGADPSATDTYEIDVTSLALVEADETTHANDTAAAAQAIQVPALFANATLPSARDVDFVAFPVTAADAGKVVRIMTEGNVATVIDVFADEAGTISLGESAGGQFDDFSSFAIPDGTQKIFVKFSPSDLADFDQPDYLAAIFITQP